jgi:hypothetical protein
VESRKAFVHAAQLELGEGPTLEHPGGAVTLALCGAWEHPPPCRWPHNNAIANASVPALFRTVFVAVPDDEARVRALIVQALRASDQWILLDEGPMAVGDGDRDLADFLLQPQT